MSALDELLQALRQIEDQLGEARGHLMHARTSLTETRTALARLDPNHPETVVPPGLSRADDQIGRTLALVEHVTDALRGFATRL